MLKVGQKVRWQLAHGCQFKGTVIAADEHGTTTTQDEPPADQTWHHGSNAALELVE